MSHTEPVIEVDVLGALDDLQRGMNGSHAARTLAKHGGLRLLLIALNPHGSVPEHKADGRVSIHTVRGHVRVRAAGRAFDLPAGRLVTLAPGERHDVEAIEASGVLVTIAMNDAREER